MQLKLRAAPPGRASAQTRTRTRSARHRDPVAHQPCSRGTQRAGIPGSGTGSGGDSAAQRPPLPRGKGSRRGQGRKSGTSQRAEGRFTRLRCGRRLLGLGRARHPQPRASAETTAPQREHTRPPVAGALTSSAGPAATPPAVTADHCLPSACSGCYLKAPPSPLRTGCAPASAAAEPGGCQCACRARPAVGPAPDPAPRTRHSSGPAPAACPPSLLRAFL